MKYGKCMTIELEMKTSNMTTLLIMINNRKQLSLDITNASTPDAKRVVLSFRPDQSTFPKGTFKIREYSHVNPEISFTSLSVKDAKTPKSGKQAGSRQTVSVNIL